MTIEQRLQRLENRNRRLTTALATLIGLSTAVLLMGAIDPNLPEVVRAKKFELIGGPNLDRVLAEIFATGSGQGGMVMYNGNGRPLIEMRPKADDTGWVSTYNRSGYPLVELGATTEGEGAMAVSNGSGYRLVMLRPARDGSGGVMTFNNRGFALVEIGMTPAGVGEVKTLDGHGHDLVKLVATEEKQGSVLTYNLGGHKVSELGATADGHGELRAWDGRGRVTHRWPAPVADSGQLPAEVAAPRVAPSADAPAAEAPGDVEEPRSRRRFGPRGR